MKRTLIISLILLAIVLACGGESSSNSDNTLEKITLIMERRNST
jgi:hypothetical protein